MSPISNDGHHFQVFKNKIEGVRNKTTEIRHQSLEKMQQNPGIARTTIKTVER